MTIRSSVVVGLAVVGAAVVGLAVVGVAVVGGTVVGVAVVGGTVVGLAVVGVAVVGGNGCRRNFGRRRGRGGGEPRLWTPPRWWSWC